jgi:PilZ domain
MADATYAIKRTNPRYPFFADAEITLRDGTSLPAQLSELSARGCYVDTLEPIPVGTKFHLSIWEAVTGCEVDGKVIYEHSGGGLGVIGMGVLFDEMAADQHSKINGWLTQLADNREKKLTLNTEVPSPS